MRAWIRLSAGSRFRLGAFGAYALMVRERARIVECAPPESEVAIFDGLVRTSSCSDAQAADFARCDVNSTCTLLATGGGVLEATPTPPAAVRSLLFVLSSRADGEDDWGAAGAQASDASKQAHAQSLGKLSMLINLCKADHRDALERMRLRTLATHTTGVTSSSYQRREWKLSPGKKVEELCNAASLLYNCEFTRAACADPLVILETMFALEDGQFRVAPLKTARAYGGMSAMLSEQEINSNSHENSLHLPTQRGDEVGTWRLAQVLLLIWSCLETVVVAGSAVSIDYPKRHAARIAQYGTLNKDTPAGVC